VEVMKSSQLKRDCINFFWKFDVWILSIHLTMELTSTLFTAYFSFDIALVPDLE